VNTKKSWALGSLLVGALSLAATAPVAMRVEVEPLRQVGASTEVAVVVQVSPEDRVRIGENAIVRIELDGGAVSSGSPMRAVWLEDDGSTRIEVTWPPGEHHLRVEIEDPSREDTGLWVGTVRIPDLSPESMVEEATELEPAPESASAPASESSGTVTVPDGDSEDAIDASLAAAAASTLEEPPVPEPLPEPSPEVDESEDTETVVETTPEPSVTDEPEIVEPAPIEAAVILKIPEPSKEQSPAAIQLPEAAAVEPEPEPVEIEEAEPEPVAVVESAPEESSIGDSEPPQIEEPAEVAEELPLVEPLRADSTPQPAEPETIAPDHRAEPAPATVPVSAELAARYEEWGSVDPETREFSMIVTRGREPATDVEADDFNLRVDGSRVPVERLGDAENAPLLLGLAIDVEADEVDAWSGMQGSLSPIVERTGGGKGRLFVATPVGVGAWDADMDAPGGVILSQNSNNVARLVVASIERFRGMHGRTFLVVLTDGRNEPAKDEWQEATEAAGEAGVPILVVALWDDKFSQRTRKNLAKLTDVSGGSLFLVQGRSQLDSAADRFGRFLDGGYSVRFKSSGGDRQSLSTISVSASDKDLDVSAPKSIR